jgi:hypothetical protein
MVLGETVSMSGLPDTILGVTPREKAGATTGARYAFQAHASLAKILDLHEAGSDYRAIFDHFDDLTILDATDNPTQMEFFQIKGTSSANWKMTALCAPSGKAPQTIIGKMYAHACTFGSSAKSATFLTNAPFDFTLSAGEKTTGDHASIELLALGSADQAKVASALDLDFPSPREPSETDFIRFERTSVPIKGFDLNLKGRLVDLLESYGSPPIAPVYRTLIADISSKANDTTECGSASELFTRKSLSRVDLTKLLEAAEKRTSALDLWAIVEAELMAGGRPFADRIHLQCEAVKFVRAKSKRDPEAMALSSAIKAVSAVMKSSLPPDLAARVATVVGGLPAEIIVKADPLHLEAAVIVEALEAPHG